MIAAGALRRPNGIPLNLYKPRQQQEQHPQRDSTYMTTLESAVRALEARLDRELGVNRQLERQMAANERAWEAQRQQLQLQLQLIAALRRE